MGHLTFNMELLPAKLGCFLSRGSMGALIPVLNVFFVSVGMSEIRAGILTAMMNTTCIVAGPLWGYLADYTKRRTLIFLVLSFGATGCIFMLPWSAYIVDSIYNSSCTNKTINVTGILRDCSEKGAENTLFVVLLLVMVVASMFVPPLLAYAEGMVAAVVKGLGATYGPQRLFGNIGFGVCVPLAGWLCDNFRVKGLSEYSPAFFTFSVISVIMIPVGVYLIRQAEQGGFLDQLSEEDKSQEVLTGDLKKCDSEETSHENQRDLEDEPMVFETTVPVTESILMKTWQLCRSPSVLVFLFTVLVGGFCNSALLSFVFKFQVEEMKRSKTQSSLVFIFGNSASSIGFILADKLTRLLRGTIPTMIVALTLWLLWLVTISFDIPYMFFVGVHLLNGIAFALFLCSMMKHVLDISPPDILMTMNQLTLTIFFYVSGILENIAGSEVYQKYGGRSLFGGHAVLCGGWIVVITVYYVRRNITMCDDIKSISRSTSEA